MVFTNSDRIPVVGTSLTGYVKTTYDALVKAFGEPTDVGASTLGKGDPPYYADYDAGDKVTAEWVLAFAVVEVTRKMVAWTTVIVLLQQYTITKRVGRPWKNTIGTLGGLIKTHCVSLK